MKLKKLLLAALLLASSIVISRLLSIRTPIVTIGFNFIPIMLSAIILGPWYTILIAGLSDLIGATLFPTGAFYFGFTISAFLTGAIYGFIIYKKPFVINKNFIFKIIISSFIVLVFISGILTTFWVMQITKKAVSLIVPTRLLIQLISLPIQVIVMIFLSKLLEPIIHKYIGDKDD